jgi:hypothetical protein
MRGAARTVRVQVRERGEALATLHKAMTAEKAPWAARVSAACAILDRGWGRAPQQIEITRRDDPES